MLALFGALVLTPDAMFLRLSGMDGPQMMGWRGTFMGLALILVWLLTSRNRLADLRCWPPGVASLSWYASFSTRCSLH
jgi:hypothetical protein